MILLFFYLIFFLSSLYLLLQYADVFLHTVPISLLIFTLFEHAFHVRLIVLFVYFHRLLDDPDLLQELLFFLLTLLFDGLFHDLLLIAKVYIIHFLAHLYHFNFFVCHSVLCYAQFLKFLSLLKVLLRQLFVFVFDLLKFML
jgi:hypothetical protein